jgi:hypothetical protein
LELPTGQRFGVALAKSAVKKRIEEAPMKPTTAATNGKYATIRGALTTALVFGALAVTTSQAGAVSTAVKFACMSDYFSYCSQHEVGSQELRQCMRQAGPKLSKRCVSALVAAGEVAQAEVDRRKTQVSNAK